MSARRRRPALGVAYYNEYLPVALRSERLGRDLDLMVEAGIGMIRVGESVWSTWEPRDGEFDVEWLAPTIDGAADRGISVMLGTPTYAIPPWLQRAHPELAVVRPDGGTVAWGARQEADYTSPVFRMYAERVIRAVLGRYGRHPAVVAVQLDNEPGLRLIANPATFARFRAWLSARFASVEELNDAWGLDYWSHRLGSWDELWSPGGNTTPAYDLAWRRFQADQTTDFIAWQASIARDLVDPSTELTTCIAYNRPALDDVALGGVLDVVSGNAYLRMQDGLDHDAPWLTGADRWFTTSPAGLIHQADRMRSSQQGRFFVTETAAGSIGGSADNTPPGDGQLAQVALLLVGRGAELVSYWHWHSLHSGAEAFWAGILGHDLEPGRIYREIAELSRTLAVAGDALLALEPDADVGILFSRESRWAMQFHPPLATPSGAPDPSSYDRFVARFVEAAVDAGLQCGVVATEQLPHVGELLERFPLLLVPGGSALDDAAAQRLVDYAASGGRLVLGPRSGYGDENGRVRLATAPGPFRAAAAVRYREFSNLVTPVPLSGGGSAEGWAEYLEPEGARVLERYATARLSPWAAVVEAGHGSGTVVTVGTLPDRATLARVFGARPRSADVFVDRPARVTAHSARNADGARLWFLHNWSDEPAVLTATRPMADVLVAERSTTEDRVDVGARGVRILEER